MRILNVYAADCIQSVSFLLWKMIAWCFSISNGISKVIFEEKWCSYLTVKVFAYFAYIFCICFDPSTLCITENMPPWGIPALEPTQCNGCTMSHCLVHCTRWKKWGLTLEAWRTRKFTKISSAILNYVIWFLKITQNHWWYRNLEKKQVCHFRDHYACWWPSTN